MCSDGVGVFASVLSFEMYEPFDCDVSGRLVWQQRLRSELQALREAWTSQRHGAALHRAAGFSFEVTRHTSVGSFVLVLSFEIYEPFDCDISQEID